MEFLESQHDEYSITKFHCQLADEITLMAHDQFRPTPWAKLKPDDQVKLKRWSPDAKLLIESEPGYSLIFRAWIWHIIDDGVFSADHKTKWKEYGDGFEAVKLLSQFLDIVQISANLALKRSYGQRTIHPDYVVKLIKSSLGYLIKPMKFEGDSYLDRIGSMVVSYDTTFLICGVKPRLVWTDPFKQDEQGVLYGFPFTNKADLEKEAVPISFDGDGKEFNSRMETVKPRINSGMLPEDLKLIIEGKPVRLVISPGVMARGWTVLKNHKPVHADLHLMVWRHPMVVAVSDTFDPPIKPAKYEDGKFVAAS
ncbi:hypothetical protein ONZ43_g242 [Nemania bipapillata]|uniref:Uncharacterized protein n=1 Tax=Nemania bipapillata TaxID=110536 RepID=A0ACC2J941_9PEZI|nr:hypothetical protein ONZ43_g242 [Nemania bipapillata]